MAIQQNWDNSKLSDYLLFDYWQPYNAWRVLANLDYYPPKKAGIPENALCKESLGAINAPASRGTMGLNRDYLRKLQIMESNVDRLRDFWLNGQLDDEPRPPIFFIEWAKSKHFRPDWLDWAIERGLYTSEQEADKTSQPDFDKASPTYPEELDFALQAWRAVSTTEEKGKPKTRIKEWLNATNAKLPKEKKLSDAAIDRISIVANWDKRGGATRTD